MRRTYFVMVSVLALTIFSTLYDERPTEKASSRTISSVDMTKDGLCIENDSQWGKDPAPLTKENICKCHPDQCVQEDSDKGYSLESTKQD